MHEPPDERTRTFDAGGHDRDEPIPESIGRYRILGKLGEGGMGVVYEAEQQNPRRRVAVKVIRGGQFVDERRVRLFQREVDTLARLDHPDIGGIFESGRTEDGRHFFAMELVRGDTLDAYLARRAGTANVRFRLALLRKIAEAVHYAHQRGVIHRDLKPSNIVVTDHPESEDSAGSVSSGVAGVPRLPRIKILDFGLARITEGDVTAATIATEVGAIKGTLAYMSPEQARGNPDDIDVRTDVYALGMILYETLTGQRPYDVSRRHLVEAVRVICEESPRSLRSASSSSSRIDHDVETIVLKALEKEPGRRYASAAALAQDIERYLAKQPILARPPSTIYQLRKFAARNRALVGGVIATIVVLVAGVVVSSVLALREAEQRRDAVAARDDLQTVVDFQSRMLRDVDPSLMGLRLMDDIKLRVGDDAIDEYLERLNPTDVALRLIDEDILARAARSIEERFAGQPLVEAQLRLTLGDTYRVLGLLDRAEPHSVRAKDLLLRELGLDHVNTLRACLSLAYLYERQGRLDEFERASLEVLESGRRVLEPDHEVIRNAMNFLGIAYDRSGRPEDAENIWREVYEIQRRVMGDDDLNTIWTLHNIGSVLARSGREAEAEPLLTRALADFRRTRGEDDRGTLWTLESLAFAYHALGKLEEAERAARDCLGGRRRVFGADHPETFQAMNKLAEILRQRGNPAEAETLLRDALERELRTLGDDHYTTEWTRKELSLTLEALGRPAD